MRPPPLGPPDGRHDRRLGRGPGACGSVDAGSSGGTEGSEPGCGRATEVLRAAAVVAACGLGIPPAAIAVSASLSAAPRADDACRSSPPRHDRFAGLGARGEIALASGGRAVLSGLRWPEDAASAAAAADRLGLFAGRPLVVTARGGQDRWGRFHADILAPEGAAPGREPEDLAGGLIAAGLAYADAGEADALCRPGLLGLEAAPRAAGLGVWREPVREARALTASAGLADRFVVAEGRVLHVGERRSRTYIDLSARGEGGLGVTVTKRTWRIMQARGLTAASLTGRRVRVRGTVEIWRGPILEIAAADLIEVLEGGAVRGTVSDGDVDRGDRSRPGEAVPGGTGARDVTGEPQRR